MVFIGKQLDKAALDAALRGCLVPARSPAAAAARRR
jgi:hypothetical protein